MSNTLFGGLISKKNRDKGGGSKKYGRNTQKCARYKAEQRREKNKSRRIIRHCKRFGTKAPIGWELSAMHAGRLTYTKP